MNSILTRVSLDLVVARWCEDTFYEEGTWALTVTMDLVQQIILKTDYHLTQAQVQANLARITGEILCSSSTLSAQYAYTWWDWVFSRYQHDIHIHCHTNPVLLFTMHHLFTPQSYPHCPDTQPSAVAGAPTLGTWTVSLTVTPMEHSHDLSKFCFGSTWRLISWLDVLFHHWAFTMAMQVIIAISKY